MSKIFKKAVITAVAFFGFVGVANAALVVQEANVGSLPDDNLISANCDAPGAVVGPALTIKGCLNTSRGTFVKLTSDENILFEAGGQAKVVAEDDAFSFLRIELDDGSAFQSLILNVLADGDGQIQFFTNIGNSGLLDLDGNGENFFTLTSDAGESFTFVEFRTFGAGVVEIDLADETRQIRIGIAGVTDVAEPGTLALLGLGLLGLGALFRRRNQA